MYYLSSYDLGRGVAAKECIKPGEIPQSLSFGDFRVQVRGGPLGFGQVGGFLPANLGGVQLDVHPVLPHVQSGGLVEVTASQLALFCLPSTMMFQA